jgi:hypothetical protein
VEIPRATSGCCQGVVQRTQFDDYTGSTLRTDTVSGADGVQVKPAAGHIPGEAGLWIARLC